MTREVCWPAGGAVCREPVSAATAGLGAGVKAKPAPISKAALQAVIITGTSGFISGT
jgi:hypothetical protein